MTRPHLLTDLEPDGLQVSAILVGRPRPQVVLLLVLQDLAAGGTGRGPIFHAAPLTHSTKELFARPCLEEGIFV